MTEENAPALASVCHRLDGIPLAIELAAARMRSLSVEEIDRHLDQRFRLLTGGSRAARPRQQTLRALIDWSYDLLDAAEQALYGRLAVFAGGFTADAAERVSAGDPLERMGGAGRTDRTRRPEPRRCRRARRGDPLPAAGDDSPRMRWIGCEYRATATRYGEGIATTSWRWRRRWNRSCKGAEQAEWLRRLDEEHGNLRAAFEWCLAAEGSTGGLRLCGALRQFWWMRGHIAEGRDWCARALAQAGTEELTQERANALSAAGALAYIQADHPAAKAWHEESLAIRRELGDLRGIATSLSNLGVLATSQGDFPAARALFEESLAILRQLDDPWGIAIALGNLGNAASEVGDYPVAKSRHEESLAIKRRLGNRAGIAATLHSLGNVAHRLGDCPTAKALHLEGLAIKRELGDRGGIATSLSNLGAVACDQGEFASARELYAESMAISRELGDRRNIAIALEGFAVVAASLDGPSRAAGIWGAAEQLRADIGAPLASAAKARYDARVAAARAALGDGATFNQAWQEGRALTLEQAIDLALDREG